MFYGEKLNQIREMFSYTRKDLSEKLQVNEQDIWRFETNQAIPDFKIMADLKEIFNVETSYFLHETYLKDVSNTGKVAFRENISDKRDGVKNEAVFLDYFFTHIRDVEQIVSPTSGSMISYCREVQKKYNLTQLSSEDIKAIAEKAREVFDVSSNGRLMYYLELSGIYIIERKLEDTVDAYSTWLLNDGYPVIVLNEGKNPAVRRNFDMGHELGHLILHRYIDFDEINGSELRKIEKEAHLFSSYFTLPGDELLKDFSEINNPTNPDDYILLKNKYKMSIQSIAYRANKEGWLSKKENRIFWKNINKLGYRTSEPLNNKLPVHIPGKIRALIYHALQRENHFVSNWLEKYSVKVEYFEYIFNIKDDFLRKHIIDHKSNYLSNHKVVSLYKS